MKKSLILLGVIGLMAIPASATQTLDGPHDREGEACHVRVNGWNENGRLQHFENRNSNTGSVNGNGNVSGTASSNMGVANLSVNAGGSIGASSSNTSQESYSGYQCKTESGSYEVYEDGHSKSFGRGQYLGGSY